jgi:hypothetical protein
MPEFMRYRESAKPVAGKTIAVENPEAIAHLHQAAGNSRSYGFKFATEDPFFFSDSEWVYGKSRDFMLLDHFSGPHFGLPKLP